VRPDDEQGLIAIRHAVENASTEPIADDGILAILRGAGGAGSHVRAVFGDVSLSMLARAGRAAGIGLPTILAAYREARATAAAANPELDEALKGEW
jgi:hypothetical protein